MYDGYSITTAGAKTNLDVGLFLLDNEDHDERYSNHRMSCVFPDYKILVLKPVFYGNIKLA